MKKIEISDKVISYWYIPAAVFTACTIVLLPISLILLTVGRVLAILSFENYSVHLYEDRIVVKKGIWFKFEKSIPISRIQDIAVRTGPVLNYYGLKTIHLETAGQGTVQHDSDATLIGIVNPEEFRDHLLKACQKLPDPLKNNHIPEETNLTVLKEIRDLLVKYSKD